MRAIKPRRWFVQRDIQLLVRTFPSETITITRETRVQGVLGQTTGRTAVTIFTGEALVIPTGGETQTFGLGQVENKDPQLLIPGTRDVQQGDFITLQGRRYQVSFEPNWWHGFLQVRLRQYQQGS